MKAVGTRVILIPDPLPEKVGSLYVLEPKRKAIRTGKVIAVGYKVEEVFKGDIIIYDEGKTGTEITIDGKKYYTVKEEEIMAVIL